MIKNIIFDFGNVFVPLKINRARFELAKLGLFGISKNLKEAFSLYERGKISSQEFLLAIEKCTILKNKRKILEIWLNIIGGFDEKSFQILTWVKEAGYQVFLLSNMNELHMKQVKEKMQTNYKKFEGFFTQLYFSHETGLIKPELLAYKKILDDHQIVPQESLFIDDLKKNTLAAESLGMHTWLFDIKKDSIFSLKKKLI